jgi:glycine cleavage system protein P-like pyridoxal-binding family
MIDHATTSQHLNVKVRDVARRLVETGESPPTGPAPDSP